MVFGLGFIFSCQPNKEEPPKGSQKIISEFSKKEQDSLIEVYMRKANQFHLYSQERQAILDEGLSVDSTIAYFWQQKAMPLFKQRKYEVGMEYIDKAVKFDRKRYQNYRAFIKSIFSKEYRSAIVDFKDYQKEFGNGYVMDHSYDFYIALSYLQLNEFETAELIFARDYERTVEEDGEDWLHHLDLFYYGISKYELKKYQEAFILFEKALNLYPQFSDAQYYQARTLFKLGKIEEASKLFKSAKENADNGFTINEDNVIYEIYPYQIRWH